MGSHRGLNRPSPCWRVLASSKPSSPMKKTQLLLFCGLGVVGNVPAFQAEVTGSSPVARSFSGDDAGD